VDENDYGGYQTERILFFDQVVLEIIMVYSQSIFRGTNLLTGMENAFLNEWNE